MPKFTDEDIAYVREHYRNLGCQAVAKHLGRGTSGVCELARRLGLVNIRRPLNGQEVERIKDLHSRGWLDSEIAKELGMTRRRLCTLRQRAGLQSNACNDRHRDQVRQRTAEQLRRCGQASLGAVRAASFRKLAAECGWPADLRPRAVWILNLLWERGPMTRRQLSDAMGLKWRGSRKSLVSNDKEGSHLAHLKARNLVQMLPRANTVHGKGRGKSTNIYMIALGVERRPQAETNQEAEHDCRRA